jgi:hypothetical protein
LDDLIEAAVTMSKWVLLTNPRFTETSKDWEEWRYEIAPRSGIRGGDKVYLWRVHDNDMYGWGVVLETRWIREGLDLKGRRRLAVIVLRKKGFEPTLTRPQIESDQALVGLIPSNPADLYALPLTTIQSNHLNDVIRGRGLEAPEGSATGWSVQSHLIALREFYGKNHWAIALSILFTAGLSVLGLLLSGLVGAIIGFALSVLAIFILPPTVTKYVERGRE